MSVTGSDGYQLDVGKLETVVRDVISGRIDDPDVVQDIVQETLVRVIDVLPRLDPKTVAAYAAVIARNLMVSLRRSEEVREKHRHRLLDPRQPVLPEEAALRDEAREALRAALSQLGPEDLEVLIEHGVMDAGLTELAHRHGSTPGALAARLARARARARVEYLLAYRRVEPPTEQCRPVLIALSSGDRRRQSTLRAAEHLLNCPTCSELAPDAMRRGRVPLLVPPVFLARTLGRLRRMAGGCGRSLATRTGTAKRCLRPGCWTCAGATGSGKCSCRPSGR